MNAALRELSELSSDVLEIELPPAPGAVQAPEVYAIHAKHFAASPELYGRWMRERLQQATAIDVVAYIEARQELDRVRRSVHDVFAKVDLLVSRRLPCRQSQLTKRSRCRRPRRASVGCGTLVRSTRSVYPRSRFPAASHAPVCRSVCKSLVQTSAKRAYSRFPTLSNELTALKTKPDSRTDLEIVTRLGRINHSGGRA